MPKNKVIQEKGETVFPGKRVALSFGELRQIDEIGVGVS
jgi:hypothetical protein